MHPVSTTTVYMSFTVSQYHFIPKQSSLVSSIQGKEMSSIKKVMTCSGDAKLMSDCIDGIQA